MMAGLAVMILLVGVGSISVDLIPHPRVWIKFAHEQIRIYTTVLRQYKVDTGIYPASAQGLQALRVKPDGVNNWQGPYLQRDINDDPWGHPYVYKYPGEHGQEPDIISLGADGAPGGEGANADIVSWKN